MGRETTPKRIPVTPEPILRAGAHDLPGGIDAPTRAQGRQRPPAPVPWTIQAPQGEQRVQRSPVYVTGRSSPVPGTSLESTEIFQAYLDKDGYYELLLEILEGLLTHPEQSEWDLAQAAEVQRRIKKAWADDEFLSRLYEAPAVDVRWEDEEKTGQLRYTEDAWWVYKQGYWYRAVNQGALSHLDTKAKPTTKYKRPFKGYKGEGLGEIPENIESYGVLVIEAGGAGVATSLPADAEMQLLSLQRTAQKIEDEREIGSGRDRYKPKLKSIEEMGYQVAWKQKAKTIEGLVNDRQMVRSLDTGLKLPELEETLTIEGEDIHERLFSRGPTHGNDVRVRFQLVCLEGETITLRLGEQMEFGSGKTTSDRSAKHENTDEIASMLVHSGQLSSVDEYDDEKHSHSEQAMIVHLSRDLSVFDKAIAKAAQGSRVVALLIDMNSAPNTVCDTCHPSIATFLTTTNWKDLVSQGLGKKAAKKKVRVGNPPLILRVSANTKFKSQNVTTGIAKAKESFTIVPGDTEVFFLERIPFEKWY